MISGTTTSRELLAAFLCACALSGCGSEDEERADNSPDSGGGSSVPDGSTPSAGSDGGTGTAQDSGMPDFGMNSESDTFFRAGTMVLKAPGLYAKPFGIEQSLNRLPQDTVDKALTSDEDADGFVDLSLLVRFLKTANPEAKNGMTAPGGGLCPFPVSESSACGPDPTFPFQSPPLAYTNGQDCQLEGTSEVASGACFVTAKGALTMNLSVLGPVPLQDAQVIGTWEGTGISNGRVRGFLPKSVAQTTRIADPAPKYLRDLSIKGGTPLTDFLSDKQLGKDSKGVDGWWFLFNFGAEPAKFDPAVAPKPAP